MLKCDAFGPQRVLLQQAGVALAGAELQELLLALVPPSGENALFDEAARKFPTAAFAVFELDIDTWDQLAEGCGRLVRFTRPRDLDPALGPEH